MKGRLPTPTALKILQGNPGKRPLNSAEPQFDPASPDIPPELEGPNNEHARAEWERVVPQLIAAGVAKRIDRTGLIAYCFEYQKWIESEQKIRTTGMFIKTKIGYLTINPYVRISKISLENMLRFMAEYGMTPSARVRIKVDAKSLDNGKDPLSEFLSKRA